MEMIRAAFEHFEGKATAPEICGYIEKHYPEQIKNKTKTWRNSISGQLSTHFAKDPSSTGRSALWLLNGEREPSAKKKRDPSDPPKRRVAPVESKSKSYDPNTKELKRKREVKTVFEPDRLQEILELNSNPVTKDAAAIELINKDHKLKLLQKLTHSGISNTLVKCARCTVWYRTIWIRYCTGILQHTRNYTALGHTGVEAAQGNQRFQCTLRLTFFNVIPRNQTLKNFIKSHLVLMIRELLPQENINHGKSGAK